MQNNDTCVKYMFDITQANECTQNLEDFKNG